MNVDVNSKIVKADFVLHYSQEIDPPGTANSARILGVCFQNIQSGQQFILSSRDEKLNLQVYLAFIADHTEAVFAHWNMRTAFFGFDVLERRCAWNNLAFAKPRPDKLFDVSIYMRTRYGDEYAPDPRLPEYLKKRGWYDGRLEKFCDVRHDAAEHLWQGHRQWLSDRAASIAKIYREELQKFQDDSTQPGHNSFRPRKGKQSTTRGEGSEKLIAALIKHHEYFSGSVLKQEAIGNNELARLANVSRSTASAFFIAKFHGHANYRKTCADSKKLLTALKMLNGEFAPHILYGSKPPGEGPNNDD